MSSELVASHEPDITERTIKRSLTQLQELGSVASSGTGRGARWERTPPSPSAAGERV